jgi:hypothetical protein
MFHETIGRPRCSLLENMRRNEIEMPYRRLGHTGVKVSALGLGGSHLVKPGLTAREAAVSSGRRSTKA